MTTTLRDVMPQPGELIKLLVPGKRKLLFEFCFRCHSKTTETKLSSREYAENKGCI